MEKGDIYTYYLRIFLTDITEPLVFKVDKETSERVERNLERRLMSCCWFSTVDGREVAVNLGCIDLINFLWQPGFLEPPDPLPSDVSDEEEDEDSTISLHFKGRATPYETEVDEAWRAWDLFGNLGEVDVDDPFISFLDVDGENVYVDARKLIYVEGPASLLSRGAKEAEEQDSLIEMSEPAHPVKKGRRSSRTQASPSSGSSREPRRS